MTAHALGSPYIDSVINQIKDAQRAGRCNEHKYTYPPPAPWSAGRATTADLSIANGMV